MKRRDFVAGSGGSVVMASTVGHAAAALVTDHRQDRPIILDANGDSRATFESPGPKCEGGQL